MPRGISTDKRLSTQIACLSGGGIRFVCRYYSTTTSHPQKRLTPSEAQALIGAGMSIVTVYEDGPTSSSYFSYSRGMQDGGHAHQYASGLGQPAGSGIYFAVDYDATTADTQGVITQYFQGVKDGLDQAGGGSAQYEIGVYGSGRVCGWLKEHSRLAAYSWLAESHGWAGHAGYTPDIRQEIASSSLCGLVGGDYEDNFADGNYGAFSSLGGSAAPIAASPTPALGVLAGSAPVALAAAAPAGGGGSSYPSRVVARARQQYDDYHHYTESDTVLRDQIRHYWEDIGFTFPGVSTAWSAVFVSWCMREGSAVDNGFKASSAHSRFVFKAIQDKRNGVGLFHGYRITDYAPHPGDIIHNNRNGQTLTYDFAAAHEAYESHSAIVVEVGSDADGNYALTIGGNESDSVGLKRVALDTGGLVRQRSSNPYIAVIRTLKS